MAQEGKRSFEATFVVGPLGIIEEVDDGACRLLGYSKSELVGMHGSQLVSAERRPLTAVSIDRMRRGEIAAGEGLLLRKDGSEIEVIVSARTLPKRRLELNLRRRVSPPARADLGSY
jgi:PAS domain S-box-containing protein